MAYDNTDKHCRECICPACDLQDSIDCIHGGGGCKTCENVEHIEECDFFPA